MGDNFSEHDYMSMNSSSAACVREALSPSCVTVQYTEQRLPQYRGNPLIEALPRTLTDEELLESMTLMPDFDPNQRSWPAEERLQMLHTLQNFSVPMSMHFELVRAVDSMLRAGYVGRAPRTPEHARRFQAIYEMQKNGVPFRQTAASRVAQISSLLIGMSGMGKTTTLKRWCAHLPQVIYHPDLNLYQVTYLHIEMPSDGSSVKGLAHAILHALDRLIPGANYYQTYALKGKPGADTLMRSVARLLHMHCVGILIGDEVQNLTNSKKGSQVLMTEMVSACNDLGLPVLFVGTNKAAKVFSLDYRLSRRASGNGFTPWRNFPEEVEEGEVNEWADFLTTLWRFQWTHQEVPLDDHMRAVLYHYSQGVIDVAIKLFASSQARAILDGSECITAELIADVYNRELKLMHPMIEALRDNDPEALAKYDDIAPIGLSSMLDEIGRMMKAKGSKALSLKPSDPTFVTRLVMSLVSSGFGEEESEEVAKSVTASGKAKNLLQATKAALDELSAPKKLPKPSAAPEAHEAAAIELKDESDYRHALLKARETRTTVFSQLKALGMAEPLDAVLALD